MHEPAESICGTVLRVRDNSSALKWSVVSLPLSLLRLDKGIMSPTVRPFGPVQGSV